MKSLPRPAASRGARAFARWERLLRLLVPVDAGVPSGMDGGRLLLVPLTARPARPACDESAPAS